MSGSKPLLMIVDDESSTLSALDRLLRNDFEVKTFLDAEEALRYLKNSEPALVLTDSIMPKMSGIEFLKKVKALWPNTIRILLSGMIETSELSLAINHGLIHRFFVKPWENEVLKLQVMECLQQRKTLLEKNYLTTLALTDPVTGLGNHRLFQEQLKIETERARRHQRPLSVLMMDLDHFKEWNDHFGHPAGDLLLKEVSAHLLKGLRSIDWVARYGGDEFSMILPDTKVEHAYEIAERLRKGFAPSQTKAQGSPASVTMSFGVAAFPDHANSAPELIQAADQALYQAKKRGRNQSSIAASPR